MITLTDDELHVVAEHLGIQTFPLVLTATPEYDRYDALYEARRRAAADLRAAGILAGAGDISADLADPLHVLAQPDRELVARCYGAPAAPRICLARRGEQHALAVRTGSKFDIEPIWCDGSPDALTQPLLRILGPARPADIAVFSATTTDLADKLNRARSAGDYADAGYALGLGGRDATLLGAALSSCRGCTEIVAYSHLDGRTIRVPGAIAIYETERGRIIAAPTISADRQLWTTISAGTDHRLTQAVAALLEGLPGGRWRWPGP